MNDGILLLTFLLTWDQNRLVRHATVLSVSTTMAITPPKTVSGRLHWSKPAIGEIESLESKLTAIITLRNILAAKELPATGTPCVEDWATLIRTGQHGKALVQVGLCFGRVQILGFQILHFQHPCHERAVIQHGIATVAERAVAACMGVNWKDYEDACAAVYFPSVKEMRRKKR